MSHGLAIFALANESPTFSVQEPQSLTWEGHNLKSSEKNNY